MHFTLQLEPSWWRDPSPTAADERRRLIEAFRVEALEDATADLRQRCEQLDSGRELINVGHVAEVLLRQWSVSFQVELADAQRILSGGDQERLERAAAEGREAAVAVRDRFLAPDRISPDALQEALNLANADAVWIKLDQAATHAMTVADEVARDLGRGTAL